MDFDKKIAKTIDIIFPYFIRNFTKDIYQGMKGKKCVIIKFFFFHLFNDNIKVNFHKYGLFC